MLPYIHIGPLELPSYGLMILLGIACGVLLLYFRARSKSFDFQDALFALFYGIIGAALGSKLFFLAQALPEIIAHADEIFSDFSLVLSLLTGGFVFYGGLIGGVAGVWIYSRQYHLPFFSLFEFLIPALPLMHGFGRIGCFLAGCCYGIPCNGPICVVFELSSVAPLHTPLFPVQLLESALLFLLTAFLLIYESRAKEPRSLVGWYLLLYGIIRMITEYFRGDEIRGFFLFFSTSQWISLALIIIAVIMLIKLKSRMPPVVEGSPKGTEDSSRETSGSSEGTEGGSQETSGSPEGTGGGSQETTGSVGSVGSVDESISKASSEAIEDISEDDEDT